MGKICRLIGILLVLAPGPGSCSETLQYRLEDQEALWKLECESRDILGPSMPLLIALK